MVAFCSTVRKVPLIVLCWKSRQWVDLKIPDFGVITAILNITTIFPEGGAS